jgi:ubiquitin carboxyl-terminal hydrolase 7
VDIVSHKILGVNPVDARIDTLSPTSTKTYRVEEIPDGQERLADNEILVPVAHFHKEIYSTFGQPFLLKLCDGESFDSVKEKIQKQLDVPDKEWEKYRVAVVTTGRARYLDDMEYDTVRVRDFNMSGGGGGGNASNNTKPYIGLEHINKNSKRARYNYMEKAIKIYN